MKHLRLFQTLCLLLLAVSAAAVYIEAYVWGMPSIQRLYIWAGVGIAALAGNALAASLAVLQYRNRDR